MIIYHGSKVQVDEPLYGFGKRENDYGQGFYCTEDIELAKEWACQTPEGGFVNKYEIDIGSLEVFTFDDADIVSWLALLLLNRKVRYSSPLEKRIAEYIVREFAPDISGYDIIKGYRADDSYFTFIRSFLSNTISIEQLGNAMKLGQLGQQICLKSRKSFEAIRFIGSDPVDAEKYYSKWMERDVSARNDFYRLLESDAENGIFARDIVDKEMTADELRIQ